MVDKIRWGILSTARIGAKAVIPAIHQSNNGVVAAVASRTLDKAQAFAQENDIPKAYGSYEELIAADDIDALYIPLPNSEHGKWSMAAAEAGKPTLCEKPLTGTVEEAQKVVDFFADRDVLLAEAFMYRFHPQHDVVRQMIREGAIGELRAINATFTFYLNRDEDVRLSKELEGGGLLDVGCYCINSMRLLTGEEPDGGQAFARFHPETDVDVSASAVLSFPSGVIGHLDCGLQAHRTNMYDLRGTDGRIRVEEAFVPSPDKPTVVQYWRGQNESHYEAVTVNPVNQYTLMVEDFADAVINKREPRFTPDDAVRNILVIENLLASARGQDGFWF